MNNKKFILVMGALLIFILSLSLVQAVININYPIASQSINGSRTVNISSAPGSDGHLNVSLSFQCTSPLSGGSSGNISSSVNSSSADTDFNFTWNSAVVTGDCTGTLTASSRLTNNSEETATVTGITINNTANAVSYASTSPASTQTVSVESGTFSVTTNEATAGATLYLGTRPYSMTGTNDSWSYTFSRSSPTIPEGIYLTYYITVDGTGTNDDVDSARRDIWIEYGNNNGADALVFKTATQDDEEEESSDFTSIFVLFIIIGGGYFLYSRK